MPVALMTILLFLVGSYCSAADFTSRKDELVPFFLNNDFLDARGLADFIEKHYGVNILLGDECQDIVTTGFSLGKKAGGRTPLQKALSSPNYENEIQIVDDCFSIYPPGFFTHFSSEEAPLGLRILLPYSVLARGEREMAGVTTIQDGYYNIFLGLGSFAPLIVHHELWHAIEFRVLAENPSAFDDWYLLNPEDFLYGTDYFSADKWEIQESGLPWFYKKYGTITEEEDRATVIEALILEDDSW